MRISQIFNGVREYLGAIVGAAFSLHRFHTHENVYLIVPLTAILAHNIWQLTGLLRNAYREWGISNRDRVLRRIHYPENLAPEIRERVLEVAERLADDPEYQQIAHYYDTLGQDGYFWLNPVVIMREAQGAPQPQVPDQADDGPNFVARAA